MPYAAYRIAELSNVINAKVNADEMLSDLAGFYFDTALSGSPTALPSLLAFARPGHVLFGSDWPYCPSKTVGFFTEGLDAYQGLDAAGHAGINRTRLRTQSACVSDGRLIPRFREDFRNGEAQAGLLAF